MFLLFSVLSPEWSYNCFKMSVSVELLVFLNRSLFQDFTWLWYLTATVLYFTVFKSPPGSKQCCYTHWLLVSVTKQEVLFVCVHSQPGHGISNGGKSPCCDGSGLSNHIFHDITTLKGRCWTSVLCWKPVVCSRQQTPFFKTNVYYC